MDFSELDKYFCCNLKQGTSNGPIGNNLSPNPQPTIDQFSNLTNGTNIQQQQTHNLSQKLVVISLISGKRSLSVNIFLKMCKNVQKLINNLKAGNGEEIGLERLKMLIQLLPNDEEVHFFNIFYKIFFWQ